MERVKSYNLQTSLLEAFRIIRAKVKDRLKQRAYEDFVCLVAEDYTDKEVTDASLSPGFVRMLVSDLRKMEILKQ